MKQLIKEKAVTWFSKSAILKVAFNRATIIASTNCSKGVRTLTFYGFRHIIL